MKKLLSLPLGPDVVQVQWIISNIREYVRPGMKYLLVPASWQEMTREFLQKQLDKIGVGLEVKSIHDYKVSLNEKVNVSDDGRMFAYLSNGADDAQKEA